MILKIGDYAKLRIVKELSFGAYLDGGPFGEILLPIKEVPEGAKPEDDIDVFIYCDSEDRLIATTLHPKAKVGELAFLEVVDVNEFGAFLDWGIPTKHLFVPFREQSHKMSLNRRYWVYVYLDEKTDRIVATSKLNRVIPKELKKEDIERYKEGDAVSLLIAERSERGYRAVVNREYWGMLYQNEIFQPIKVGQEVEGFIKKIRADHKIDLALQPQGYKAAISPAVTQLLEKLEADGGFLPLTDKSSPTLIYDVLQMSKKQFKRTIGNLYKEKRIRIEQDGIYLNK